MLINPYRFSPPYDTDAQAYITAVETADGQALETGVKDAINAFVVGCKADGIWTAIKASCILAGARTLSGALVPLVGAAPTNFNFVAGDYNRKTGLIGNGSTKYLDSGRSNSADPQNSQHLSVYISTKGANSSAYMGSSSNTFTGASMLQDNDPFTYPRCRTSSANNGPSYAAPCFFGVARSVAASFTVRASGTNQTMTQASEAPIDSPIFIYRRGSASPAWSNSRLAFYSIGESLDLALLDTRVTTLINAFAAAIP